MSPPCPIVHEWDLVESLLKFSLQDCLQSQPREHPLLMAEPSFNTRSARERMAELVFERFEVPAFFLARDAVLTT